MEIVLAVLTATAGADWASEYEDTYEDEYYEDEAYDPDYEVLYEDEEEPTLQEEQRLERRRRWHADRSTHISIIGGPHLSLADQGTAFGGFTGLGFHKRFNPFVGMQGRLIGEIGRQLSTPNEPIFGGSADVTLRAGGGGRVAWGLGPNLRVWNRGERVSSFDSTGGIDRDTLVGVGVTNEFSLFLGEDRDGCFEIRVIAVIFPELTFIYQASFSWAIFEL